MKKFKEILFELINPITNLNKSNNTKKSTGLVKPIKPVGNSQPVDEFIPGGTPKPPITYPKPKSK